MAFSSHLVQLAQWMAGHFNNFDQAIAEPIWFANIHVYQCPLSTEILDGDLSFYVEQVYDIDLIPERTYRPYRQRVLQLMEKGGEIFIQNYALKDPEALVGAGRDLKMLEKIQSDSLELLPGCVMSVEWTGSSFKGKNIPGKQCIVFRKNQETYLHAEFELTPNRFISLDQGRDPATDKVIWGSLSGPFQFTKKEDFSHYIPSV